MKSYFNFLFLAYVASTVKAVDFSEDIYMFLPFLRNYQPPPPCPPNELYNTCTGKCSDCTQRGRCIVTECMQGCDCAPRFFRVKPDGPCEPVANCPRPECGENEVFRECGPICERCTTLRCRSIRCGHKCYCKEGYLRNKEGTCIPEKECPKRDRCSHNEEWAESGPVDEYCLQGGKGTHKNVTQDFPQCYCRDGYKRNMLGRCINETLCPLIRCLHVEVYHNCIPSCNTTCRNYGDLNCTEDENCFPGCFCPSGYVMNDLGSCIPVGNCSLAIEQVKIMEPPEITDKDDSSDSESTSTPMSDESTNTTDSTPYPSSGETSEDDLKDSEDTSAETTVSPDRSEMEASTNPTVTASAIAKGPKGKIFRRMKYALNISNRGPKNANTESSSKTSREDVDKANDEFDNVEI